MKVALIPNPKTARAIESAYALRGWLSDRGITPELIYDSAPSYVEGASTDASLLSAEAGKVAGCDLVVALGGDGTTLRAARLVGYAETPILSFNYGNLGFLSGSENDSVIESLETVLSGEVTPERRATLSVTFVPSSEGGFAVPDDDLACGTSASSGISQEPLFALNEVVVVHGASARIMDFTITINDVDIASMRGDGVLVATATGSTAYALSAGGPVIAPGHKGMEVVPIAPHTINSRAIVTGPSDVIEIDLSRKPVYDVGVFIDGRKVLSTVPERVMVQRGPGDILLYQLDGKGFYRKAANAFFGGAR